MRSARRVAALMPLSLASAITLVASCQLVNGLSSLQFVDTGPPDGPIPDGSGDAPTDEAAAGRCVFDRDASLTPMVPFHYIHKGEDATACIDSTEVTFQQFYEFSQDAAPPREGTACAHVPRSSLVSWDTCDTPPDWPVSLVPWCGAFWYCDAHGLQLCSVDYPWLNACRGLEDAAYPYGDSYKHGVCNVDSDGPAPVPWNDGSCEGAAPGLFDMVGNVAEWTGACNTGPTLCYALGGGDKAGHEGCASAFKRPMTSVTMRDPQIGFRCCTAFLDGCP
jgi:hypothetical protein